MSAPVLDAPDSLSRLIPSRVARGFFLTVVSGAFFNCLNVCWTFVGAAIIVAATSYVAHREARAGGKKA